MNINFMISEEITHCVKGGTGMVNALSSFQESILCTNSLVYSFWISIVAIFIIYSLKYAFKIKPNGEKFLPLFIEFFLDICISLIPLIAVGSHSANKDVVGIMLILLSIFIIIIGIYLRKKHGDFYAELNGFNWKSAVCAIFAIIICIALITSVFIFISILWRSVE